MCDCHNDSGSTAPESNPQGINLANPANVNYHYHITPQQENVECKCGCKDLSGRLRKLEAYVQELKQQIDLKRDKVKVVGGNYV